MDIFLILCGMMCGIASVVLMIIFFIRWMMRRKKFIIGIIAAACAALVLPLIIVGGMVSYNSMTPEERAAIEEQNRINAAEKEAEKKEEATTEPETKSEAETPTKEEEKIPEVVEPNKTEDKKPEPEKPAEEKHTHKFVETERTTNVEQKKITIKQSCSCGKSETNKVDMSADDISKYLKANCKTYTYEEIARYPDKYKDKLAVFTGEVIQVQELLGTTTLLVNITKEGDDYFSYYTDTVYVSYKYTDELKILEDDIITMYGKMNGEKTYLSVLGAVINAPHIEVYYAELNK